MIRFAKYFTFPIFLLSLFTGQVQADGCLKIIDDFRAPSLAVIRPAIQEIYQEAGICVKFENKPAMRAHKIFANGQSDGLLMRSKEVMVKLSSNYVTTDKPVTRLYSYILSNKKMELGPTIDKYNFTTIAVYKSLQKAYRLMLEPYGIYVFPYDARGFTDLLGNIEQGILDGVFVDNLYLSYLEERDSTLRHRFDFSEKMLEREGYLILHPKHKDILEKLNAAINDMRPQYPILN